MGGIFDFSLLDVWNRPEIQLLRYGTKLAAKGISSANAKAESAKASIPEYDELVLDALGGNSDAQCLLALRYAEKQDSEKALFWLEKSAKQGNEYAKEILDLYQ